MSSPVGDEVLKAEDVEQADGQVGGLGAVSQVLIDDAVDFLNDPYEELVVDGLRVGTVINIQNSNSSGGFTVKWDGRLPYRAQGWF